ncbi:tetratricopeptide repeat protein [Mucilaginibacter rubeus]|uniref:Tetratricopeptide repeat protein n=1 Tax=Mucilaginibacter rubeus TaxID=2027860 RepID=A0AAE6JKZ6_9SPHI|nr:MULTISPECIES: tetratricopeptide repeat protein [Mucilaginibacter]QEM07616.1 tetratricopeptide repeat protein [Mucilaginibacter rubeus]QEM20070.1 tetratricopeptide repeat protein [Mucilaginibacter gossypii]QTE43219.1 tetratricopeptide repeat protein [Mucilaginibacter rubeus]QTE49819.1 tetratricopeptide repeat protein [Mucilaginibacter rubeus]QTE54911.1 tetratricopeptide repeat protein [Mucilaginibacter rubeus]
MRALYIVIIIAFCFSSRLLAQDNELLLARQYNANGEPQKALEIYQKLYKQNNENYYSVYVNTLLNLKKFDDAESVTKKLIRRHPDDHQYAIMLGNIYTQGGNMAKADAIYDDLIKNLPADQGEIAALASQFYQSANIDYAIKIFQQGRKLLKNDNMFTYELINLYRFKRDKISLTDEYLNFLPQNPNFINQAENAFSNVYEGSADYDMLKTALLRRIQKDPQQTIYADLLTWQYLQQKEFDLALNQALALSRRQNDDGNSIYDLCRTFIANEAYDEAIRGYEYIISKGKTTSLYILSKIELINTKNLKVTSGKYLPEDLLGLEKDYNDLLTEFGRNSSTAFAMQKLANLQAFKLHKLKDAPKLLEETTRLNDIRPNLLADCKLDLGDIYLLNNQPWEATLLYSQVEKDFPATAIGQDALFRNAKMAYYTGDFTWAKGQLDVLKVATSQLIANDALNLLLLIQDNLAADSSGAALKVYARADLQIFAQNPEKAVMILDSIGKKFPNNALDDDIMMSKSRILIQQKDYAGAVPLLKKILEEHPADLWADDAVFMLGDIYENRLNDKTTARNYYQKIITDYPGSLWINEARKRFRLLRGDKPDAS